MEGWIHWSRTELKCSVSFAPCSYIRWFYGHHDRGHVMVRWPMPRKMENGTFWSRFCFKYLERTCTIVERLFVCLIDTCFVSSAEVFLMLRSNDSSKVVSSRLELANLTIRTIHLSTSVNAPFKNRNMHISVFCFIQIVHCALWDMWQVHSEFLFEIGIFPYTNIYMYIYI